MPRFPRLAPPATPLLLAAGTAFIAIAGCAPGLDPRLTDHPNYTQGYAHGCDTGRLRTQSFSQKKNRDDSLFDASEEYRVGWRQGYNACVDQQPRAAPDDYFGDRGLTYY